MTKGTEINRVDDHHRGIVTYQRWGVADNAHYDTIEEAVLADTDAQFSEMYFTISCNECGTDIDVMVNIDDLRKPSTMHSNSYIVEEIAKHNSACHYIKPRIYNCEPVDADDGVEAWSHKGCTHGYMPNGDVLD